MKERIKTTAIVLLFVNLISLTFNLWLDNGLWREDINEMITNLPALSRFFDRSYSIPGERLSYPRKILINDGSLWIAYYNTDAVFSAIEARTRRFIEDFLKGEAAESREMTVDEWQKSLESVSIYVEYPIAYTTKMLCAVMGVSDKNAPREIDVIKDFVILPSSEESGILLAVRDAYDNDKVFAYRFDKEKHTLPASDMAIYTENNSGYYEPAFSTALEPEGVEIDPMVLFSDSRPEDAVLTPENPIEDSEKSLKVLDSFFNNVNTAGSYSDGEGGIVYVENYSDVHIYSHGLFEYKSVSKDKGVEIAGKYDSYYETVNAAIHFAENLWGAVSDEPLSVLITSDLTESDGDNIHITMDYYFNGRPVAISLAGSGSIEQLNHGIEMDIHDGMIVAYRQLFRRYVPKEKVTLGEDFISALDSFVNTFAPRKGTVIKDIYIGYTDRGSFGDIRTCWLAEIKGDDVTYSYQSKEGDR